MIDRDNLVLDKEEQAISDAVDMYEQNNPGKGKEFAKRKKSLIEAAQKPAKIIPIDVGISTIEKKAQSEGLTYSYVYNQLFSMYMNGTIKVPTMA